VALDDEARRDAGGRDADPDLAGVRLHFDGDRPDNVEAERVARYCG